MILIENNEIALATDVEEVKLDIDTIDEFEFYSGMFCALTGSNPTGKAFVVEQVKSFNFNQKPKEGAGAEKQIQNTSMYYLLNAIYQETVYSFLRHTGCLRSSLHHRFIIKRPNQ